MRRILIVEDDPDLRELLGYDLQQEGFEVDATGFGTEALRICQRRPPDLVLLDVMLPDYSGIDICQALRRSAETKNVPIVFLTACGSESDRVRGLEMGGDDYISKPFSMRELVLRIRGLLKRHGATPAAVPLSPIRMAHRELLRVWTGFATNHIERREWREAREIWRAILRRFEGDLLAEELAEVRAQIKDCDSGLEEGRVPDTIIIAAASPARP
jgi:DNA-binding response OmpR family regulator